MASATLTKFVKIRGGKTKEYAVQASASIKRGDFLTCDADGAVGQAIALPGTNATPSSTSGGSLKLLCADEDFTADASGVSTDGQGRTKMVVRITDDSFERAMRIYHATPGSAEPTDLAWDGTTYEIVRYRFASAGEWDYLLNIAATGGEVTPQELSAESNDTDDYGIVWTKVTQANRQQG